MGLFDEMLGSIFAARATQKVFEHESKTLKKRLSSTLETNLHMEKLDTLLNQEKAHYQSFKDQCIEHYRYTYFVDEAICQLISEHSFEMIDQMPEDLRQSAYFKKRLSELADHHMRLCRECYTERCASVTTIHNFIRELTHFPEIENRVKNFLCNDSYFSSEQNAARSVLRLDIPIKEQFENILSAGLPSCITKIMAHESLIHEALEKKEIDGEILSDTDVDLYVVSNAMLCTMTASELDELKQMVLFLALYDDRSHGALVTNLVATNVALSAFGITTMVEDNLTLNPGVDFMLADAIRSSKSGNLKESDDKFQIWLNNCGQKIATDQYDIFQAVFKEICAYSSECVLLDYMVQNGIEHSVEQEKRLLFLKENKNMFSQNISKFSPVTVNQVLAHESTNYNCPIFVYDHRFLSWNTNEVEQYFKGLDFSGKSQEVAAVVDKWSKNVTIDSRKWDNTIITQLIRETILQEFDYVYKVNSVKAGVFIDEEIDTTPAVYIKATPEARYQDLSFLIIGEPMTKNQLNLSILVVATPETNAISNDKIMKQIITVKEKHNPRLETYIETFKSIVIDKLNNWIIQVNGTQDIY